MQRTLAEFSIFADWQDGEVLKELAMDPDFVQDLKTRCSAHCLENNLSPEATLTVKESLLVLLKSASFLRPVTKLLQPTISQTAVAEDANIPLNQLRKWRRWTPQELEKQPIKSQLGIEKELTNRCRRCMVSLLLPYSNFIPALDQECKSGKAEGHFLGKNR